MVEVSDRRVSITAIIDILAIIVLLLTLLTVLAIIDTVLAQIIVDSGLTAKID